MLSTCTCRVIQNMREINRLHRVALTSFARSPLNFRVKLKHFAQPECDLSYMYLLSKIIYSVSILCMSSRIHRPTTIQPSLIRFITAVSYCFIHYIYLFLLYYLFIHIKSIYSQYSKGMRKSRRFRTICRKCWKQDTRDDRRRELSVNYLLLQHHIAQIIINLSEFNREEELNRPKRYRNIWMYTFDSPDTTNRDQSSRCIAIPQSFLL